MYHLRRRDSYSLCAVLRRTINDLQIYFRLKKKLLIKTILFLSHILASGYLSITA